MPRIPWPVRREGRSLAEVRADLETRQVVLDAALERDITALKAQGRREAVLAEVHEAEDIARWARHDRRSARRYARRSARVAPTVSGAVYAMAVGTAVGGQVSTAIDVLHWPVYGGVGMSVFVEGFTLSMALTARDQRLAGERAVAPRMLTWIGAGFASAVNAYAHSNDPLAAVLLGAASLVGITVWEIRSGLPLRKALREKGLISETRPRLGVAYSARFPVRAFDAFSASIADPAVSTRDEAIDAGGIRRARRRPIRLRGRWTVWGWWRTDGPADGRTDDQRAADGETVAAGMQPTLGSRTDGPQQPPWADEAATADGPVDARVDGVGQVDGPAGGAGDGRTADSGGQTDRPVGGDRPSAGRTVDRSKPRDYLAEVRPVYRHMVVSGARITRDALGGELRARGISVPNAQIGEVMRTLRAEMPPGSVQPETSPEAAEVTS